MKQALEMALEFIERVNKHGWILADFEPEMYNTITAIKEALAEPQQEPQIAFNAEVIGYIAPQRSWVGLTDEEKNEFATSLLLRDRSTVQVFEAIEAKLKEKNT